MALVKDGQIVKLNKERHGIHKSTNCTYSVFVAENGEKYFQLDTNGSQDRKIIGKTSQTIQFDCASAKRLKEILELELGI